MQKLIQYHWIKAGYPSKINFEAIPSRIANIKDDLVNIINGQLKSWFWNLVLNIYNEVHKATTV